MMLEALGDSTVARIRAQSDRLRRALLVACVAALAFSASGCATIDEMSQGLIRPQDPYCDAQYSELSKYDDVLGKALAAGAVAAGATALVTGDWGAALAAFVVTSVATNYLITLQRQEEAERRDIFLKDVNGENQVIDGVTQAFNTLADCRFAAAQQVKADWRAGRKSQPQAQLELSKLAELFQWDLKLGRKVQARIDNRGQQFAEASTLVGGQDQESPAVATPPVETAPVESEDFRETHRWSNVRSAPGTSSAKIATLEPRTQVVLLGPAEGSQGWSRIRLKDGREGFIYDTLLVEPGMQPKASAVAKKKPEPEPAEPVNTVAGVTQSNQVKRQTFASTIDEASTTAQAAFNLEADEQLGLLGAPEARSRS